MKIFINKFTSLKAVLLCATFVAVSLTHALPRDKTERDRFVKENPCPANGNTKGPCPGYQVDHKKALMNGGDDKPSNMQWQKSSDHKEKTKQDFHECKSSSSCAHRGIKKKR